MTRITLNGSVTITVDSQKCTGWRVGDTVGYVQTVSRRWWQFWKPRYTDRITFPTITDIQP